MLWVPSSIAVNVNVPSPLSVRPSSLELYPSSSPSVLISTTTPSFGSTVNLIDTESLLSQVLPPAAISSAAMSLSNISAFILGVVFDTLKESVINFSISFPALSLITIRSL